MQTRRHGLAAIRLYHPADDRAQVSIEAEIYLEGLSTLVLQRDLQCAAYAHGRLVGRYPTVIEADLALHSALGDTDA